MHNFYRTQPRTEHRIAVHAPACPSWEAAFSLTIATVLTALFTGLFVTYSASVVLGLAQVDDVTYVRAVQGISSTAQSGFIGILFLGCVPSIAWALAANRSAGRVTQTLLLTAIAACGSVIAITVLRMAPLTAELDTYIDLDPGTASFARRNFESSWNRLNLVRAVLSAGGLLAISAVPKTSVYVSYAPAGDSAAAEPTEPVGDEPDATHGDQPDPASARSAWARPIEDGAVDDGGGEPPETKWFTAHARTLPDDHDHDHEQARRF